MTSKLLIPLSRTISRREITLYIKGFLSKGDTFNRYNCWLDQHNLIMEKHKWKQNAYGYHWQSGQIWNRLGDDRLMRLIPYPVISLGNIGWRIYNKTKILKPQMLALTFGLDIALFTGQVIYNYYDAKDNCTKDLVQTLKDLSDEYDKVRVVSHSLGSNYLIRALRDIPMDQRPHVNHMCAPCCVESEISDILPTLSRDKTYIYHSQNDFVLSDMFKIMNDENPVGSNGLIDKYDNVYVKDVSEHFGYFVHNHYRHKFHEFVFKE